MGAIAVALAALVMVAPGVFTPSPAGAADPVKTAIDKGLRRIEQGAASYLEHRTCFSCHHQALSILAMTGAVRRGFKVAPGRLQEQIDVTLGEFRSIHERLREGEGLIGLSTTAVYALYSLADVGHPADETTKALVEYLLVRQREDGGWPPRGQRPPLAGSLFTNGALALRGLGAYGPAADAAGGDVLRRRREVAIARGLEWLRRNTPVDTEDKTSRLRGLIYATAPAPEIEAARAGLLGEQRPDGSWAQLAGREGDAYATATALVALRRAGLPATRDAYVRGVQYLMRTQGADGAWIVQTRSRPVQPFFDNGDPGGPSQFISFAATAWAVLALLEALPEP